MLPTGMTAMSFRSKYRSACFQLISSKRMMENLLTFLVDGLQPEIALCLDLFVQHHHLALGEERVDVQLVVQEEDIGVAAL